jgi:hypothetical protein
MIFFCIPIDSLSLKFINWPLRFYEFSLHLKKYNFLEICRWNVQMSNWNDFYKKIQSDTDFILEELKELRPHHNHKYVLIGILRIFEKFELCKEQQHS